MISTNNYWENTAPRRETIKKEWMTGDIRDLFQRKSAVHNAMKGYRIYEIRQISQKRVQASKKGLA